MKLPDYNDLLDSYEAEQQRELDRLPICSCCDEPIQQDTAICIDDEWLCDDCLNTLYRRDVEYY
jgi:formylmethanofuran dehydrogenase subunit E